MDKLKDIYQNLTADELRQAILEISKKNEVGLFDKNGIIRKIQLQIKKVMNEERFPIEIVVSAITWEISRRWYNGVYGITEGNIEE